MDVMIVLQTHAQLFQIIDALRAAGRLTCGLHGGQQERNQDADDGNHHQQLH